MTSHKVEELFGQLINSEYYLFPKPGNKIDAPNEKGVYIIFDSNCEVVHVGRTPRAKNGILQRLKDHLAGNSSFVKHYLNGDRLKLRQGYRFKCLVVQDERERALLEYYTIGHLCPKHIR
ncbi:MAG: GIY-YIG nuclease family protein [Sphingobacteriia bacterium]|nr:GIY-YIG nuclease family protein [Sphingobacteriia bacterium]